MKTIFGKIATFVSGTVAGFFAFGMFMCWCDSEDNSFVLNAFPNARQRYIKDIKAAREEERAKVNRIIKNTFNTEDD